MVSTKLLVYSPLSLRFGGGFERWMLEVAPRLKKFGVSTRMVCTRSTVGDVERISSETIQKILREVFAEYVEVPYVSFPLGSSNSPIPSVKAMGKILTAMDFDVLYFANAYAFQDVLVCVLKFIRRKPVVSGQHAVLFQESVLHDLYVSTLGKFLVKRFDAHHVLNFHDMRVFERWGLRRVYLIPIGVDTRRFKPKRQKGGRSKFRVLFVGRLTLQKGVDILCESVRMLEDEALLDDLEFLIVGSGPLEPLVRKVAERCGNVTCMGRVTDEALPEIYGGCDLFVMPSRRETFGMVALEAQACGLPTVAANVSGPSDIVVDGVTGILIPREDPRSLVSAIRECHMLWSGNYERYREMCVRARENAVKRFDWDIIVSRLYDMLMTVGAN